MTETASGAVQLVALAPLVALVGALVNGLFGRGIREPASGVIASAAVAVGFVLSLVAFVAYPGEADGFRFVFAEFLRAGSLAVDLGFLIDQLSLVMALVITGVGFLIHVYSVGYMRGDPGHARHASSRSRRARCRARRRRPERRGGRPDRFAQRPPGSVIAESQTRSVAWSPITDPGRSSPFTS